MYDCNCELDLPASAHLTGVPVPVPVGAKASTLFTTAAPPLLLLLTSAAVQAGDVAFSAEEATKIQADFGTAVQVCSPGLDPLRMAPASWRNAHVG